MSTKTNDIMTSQLDQLKKFTKIVADTGDFESMKAFQPQDATTNPSLIYKAVQKPEYQYLMDKAIVDNKGSSLSGEALGVEVIDTLLIAFGTEILKMVPGRVSTEVDAHLSFDTEASIEKARKFIKMYSKKGVDKERVLIKLASTWEGVQAAKVLQKEGIRCNMTLMFSLPQAVMSAEVGAQLVSPFVGRIYDWHKASTGNNYHGADDPGVHSVQRIYNYYKKFDYSTEVMGASFRYKEQITELAGCDLLTISPELLKELGDSEGDVKRKLNKESAKVSDLEKLKLDEKKFRYLVNDDAMAIEKLAQGIRLFAADGKKLKEMILKKL